MKNLLILSFFLHLNAYSQVDKVRLKKEKQTSFFANIEGYYDGEINSFLICSSKGIVCSKEFVVTKFNMRYGDKSHIIKGNCIPDSICLDLRSCCNNEIIFFTDIVGVNKLDEYIYVNPFSLIAVKHEK